LLFSHNVTHLGPPHPIPVATVRGFAALVVFQTYSDEGTGFRLSFKATGNPISDAEYGQGRDSIFDDETMSPFSLPSSNCSEFGCVDIFAMTSAARVVTDSEFYLKISLNLNFPIPSCTNQLFNIYKLEGDTFNLENR